MNWEYRRVPTRRYKCQTSVSRNLDTIVLPWWNEVQERLIWNRTPFYSQGTIEMGHSSSFHKLIVNHSHSWLLLWLDPAARLWFAGFAAAGRCVVDVGARGVAFGLFIGCTKALPESSPREFVSRDSVSWDRWVVGELEKDPEGTLSYLLWRFGATWAGARVVCSMLEDADVGMGFGGAAAIGTTPLLTAALAGAVLGADPEDGGIVVDSDALALGWPVDAGAVVGICVEFFREGFFGLRTEPTPTGILLPAPLFRFFITSVLRDSGRTTPWSLRNRPHALQSGWPSGFRRHNGVVWVKQLVQVVTPWSLFLEPPGLPGLDGLALLNPERGGEFGDVWDWFCIPWWRSCAVFGVELVRGIFCFLGSWSRLRISLTDVADPCVRARVPPRVHSGLSSTTSASPIVTCFVWGLGGSVFGSPEGRYASHWKPEFRPKAGSSVNGGSLNPAIFWSGNGFPSSPFSESAPKLKTFWLLLAVLDSLGCWVVESPLPCKREEPTYGRAMENPGDGILYEDAPPVVCAPYPASFPLGRE